MSESAAAVVALIVLGWAIISGALARHNVTGPLIFTIAGYLLANPDWGLMTVDVETESVHALAEITLVLVLFSDAARMNVSKLRHDFSLPLRLLGIGLPLTLILGGVTAALIFGDFTWALAGFVGAALAPTDAALSAPIITDEHVPARLRTALNAESGLNDGIATPVVTFMLAVAATQLGVESSGESFSAGSAFGDLGLGIAAGVILGWGGAAAINFASRRDWLVGGGRRIATLAIVLAAYLVALAIGGNGFIAAFAAGISFGTVLDEEVTDVEQAVELPELGGQLLALVVWFLFGATLLPIAFDHLDASVIGFALLSLTLTRMLPVALSMIGSGLDRTGVLFLGWFGPRGLASIVFALLAVEELGLETPLVGEAVGVVALTVLFSVVLHGVTAGPAGRHYPQSEQAEEPTTEGPRPPRGFLHHSRKA
jgi:NhaP-type Na+/H+ or K+/H+ antiporter